MFVSVAIGCVLVTLTTIVHTAAMVLSVHGLEVMQAERRALKSRWREVMFVAAVVVMLLLVALAEASLWAATYVALGAISSFEEAIYFSTVTYTTLGFGDLVLDNPWRLLSAIEAANGIIMFGWTTALLVAAVQRVCKPTGGHRV